MRYFIVMVYKMSKSYWFLIMALAPVTYGIGLYLYLNRYDSSPHIFYEYTIYFNCAIPFGISLMISLYVKYEEQIGHFNHFLQLQNKIRWSIGLILVSIGSIMISTLISIPPLWLLIGNPYFKDILLYFILTTVFSLPIIIILWFIALKINTSVCLSIGVFFSIFFVYFGAQSLGDSIWQYIPLLYGTRYLHLFTTSHYEISILVWSLYAIISVILLGLFILWFNKWEGRTISE